MKAGLRKRALAGRFGDNTAACARLTQALAPFEGAALAGYWPIRGEADPLPVLREWSGPVALPVVVARAVPLIFRRWSGEPLVAGAFGTSEPAAEAPELIPHVLIVPLVGFDTRLSRLGYGGGFYDRTLARLRAAGPVTAIGFAFEGQRLEVIPQEPTDEPLDLIVTESSIYTG